MPTLKFTTEQLQDFFSGKIFHKSYEETVKLSYDLKIHSDGIYPKALIECRRPSESQQVYDYRKKIWEPITMPVFGNVITELMKIRRSSEWSIRFDNSKTPASVHADETLEKYLSTNFPELTSVTNWVFDVLIKAYCIDANALVCVMPFKDELTKEIPKNEYLKPFPIIYYSEQVIAYEPDDYAVVKSTDKVLFTEKDSQHWGDVYLIFTTEKVMRYKQVKKDGTMQLDTEYIHNIGQLPVTKTKGLFLKSEDGVFIYTSRLYAMVPRLNEALREYSDLQAEVVQNIFSEKWEYTDSECSSCNGTGQVTKDYGGTCACNTCEGTGVAPRGPYSALRLKMPMAGEGNNMPTPPVGYVQKDTSIVTIQDDRVDKHMFNALASINMQYLMKVPLNQSGYAKDVDKDELNTFVNSIAENLIAVLDKVIYFINEYRYKTVVANPEARRSMLPVINVPERFDFLSANTIANEISTVKNAKVNPIIINKMEEEFANKKFSADPMVRDQVMLMIKLDPLSGMTEEDKIFRLNNNGITKESYIISSNIVNFIERAMDELGDKFLSMPMKEKREQMKTYAYELIENLSPEKAILSDMESESSGSSSLNENIA